MSARPSSNPTVPSTPPMTLYSIGDVFAVLSQAPSACRLDNAAEAQGDNRGQGENQEVRHSQVGDEVVEE